MSWLDHDWDYTVFIFDLILSVLLSTLLLARFTMFPVVFGTAAVPTAQVLKVVAVFLAHHSLAPFTVLFLHFVTRYAQWNGKNEFSIS